MKLIPVTPEAIKERGKLFAHISKEEFKAYQAMNPMQRKYYEQQLERKVKGLKK